MWFDKLVLIKLYVTLGGGGGGLSWRKGKRVMFSPLSCSRLLIVTFSAPAPGSTNEFRKQQVDETGFPKSTHDTQ